MTKHFLLWILLLTASTGYPQQDSLSQLRYHQSVALAERYIVVGKWDSAAATYKSAFEVGKPFAIDIYNSFLVASRLGDSASIHMYAMMLAKKGVGSAFFKNNRAFIPYQSNSNWRAWIMEADIEKRRLKISYGELINRIERISFTADNIYRLWVVSMSGTIKETTEAEQVLNRQNVSLIDSLIEIIDRYGYPSEDRIGVNIIGDSMITCEPIFSRIILSGYSGPNGIGGTTFDEILQSALDSGFVKPFFYARMHDFKNYQNNRRYGTNFFCGFAGNLYYNAYDSMTEIEAHRKSIGLEPLNDYAKLILFKVQNKESMFRLCCSFLEQDRFLVTPNEKSDFLKNHAVYQIGRK